MTCSDDRAAVAPCPRTSDRRVELRAQAGGLGGELVSEVEQVCRVGGVGWELADDLAGQVGFDPRRRRLRHPTQRLVHQRLPIDRRARLMRVGADQRCRVVACGSGAVDPLMAQRRRVEVVGLAGPGRDRGSTLEDVEISGVGFGTVVVGHATGRSARRSFPATCAARCENISSSPCRDAGDVGLPTARFDRVPPDPETAGELGAELGVVEPAHRVLLTDQEVGRPARATCRWRLGPWPRSPRGCAAAGRAPATCAGGTARRTGRWRRPGRCRPCPAGSGSRASPTSPASPRPPRHARRATSARSRRRRRAPTAPTPTSAPRTSHRTHEPSSPRSPGRAAARSAGGRPRTCSRAGPPRPRPRGRPPRSRSPTTGPAARPVST